MQPVRVSASTWTKSRHVIGLRRTGLGSFARFLWDRGACHPSSTYGADGKYPSRLSRFLLAIRTHSPAYAYPYTDSPSRQQDKLMASIPYEQCQRLTVKLMAALLD